MNDDRLNWHAAFYDAIRLELEDYLDMLTFEFKHQLNTDPLIIAALILKKKKQAAIEKNIESVLFSEVKKCRGDERLKKSLQKPDIFPNG